MEKVNITHTDVLVVGAGGAGVRAAIEVAKKGFDVIVTSKGPIGRSGITPLAQWSFEATFGYSDKDTLEVHFNDTVKEGRYLGDQNLVEALAQDAGDTVRDLAEYGTKFKMTEDGRFRQTKIPGQSNPRSVMLVKGGYGMMMGLKKEVKKYKSIHLLEDAVVTELLKSKDSVSGAIVINIRESRMEIIQAKAVILATGGYEELWLNTDTPPESVGDGVRLGLLAGAELVDMEQMLFYPIVVCYPESIKGIIIPYEACLEPDYIAGKLLNGKGEEFLPSGSPPVRDILVRKMFNELASGNGTEHGYLYLDLTKSPKGKDKALEIIRDMIPAVYKHLLELGYDVLKERIEVAPVAHFSLGGIRIDEWSKTNVQGLFAAGEVAGNLHGANRLSGNALAETQVFGRRAGKSAVECIRSENNYHKVNIGQVNKELEWLKSLFAPKARSIRPGLIMRRIKEIMWKSVGAVRSEGELNEALSELNDIRDNDLSMVKVPNSTSRYNNELIKAIDLRTMVDVAEIVIQAALLRKESRGHHFRKDFPETDDQNWFKHTLVKLQGRHAYYSTCPVKLTKVRPQQEG